MLEVLENLALNAAEQASAAMTEHLVKGRSFVFEAGAGAGKTYSLIEALKWIIRERGRKLTRKRQQVACITYTTAARDILIAQTDANPVIYCETTHAFAWTAISGFQKQLRETLPRLARWKERLDEAPNISNFAVQYTLGRRAIEGESIFLHHDDIFPLFCEMLANHKFRTVLSSRFPIILIDEYQDTNAALIEALKAHLFGRPECPQFGFFGDHWQKIYGDGCGSIEHDILKRVSKGANFRSPKIIVYCLNRLRPDLEQAVPDQKREGSIHVFHTNGWSGKRETRNHWQTDLPAQAADAAFTYVKDHLATKEGWDTSITKTKILFLTHRALATNIGYPSLPSVFAYSESYYKKGHKHIAFLVDTLEPAMRAFQQKKYGAMFEIIGERGTTLSSPADKAGWADAMQRLCDVSSTGTVGAVMAQLLATDRLTLPDEVLRIEQEIAIANRDSEISSRAQEVQKLRDVKYHEIRELARHLDGHSPFETKHGVKGDQFENVLIVFGRGWNEYNFNEYLEMSADLSRQNADNAKYARNRNLFYVVCSRPKSKLVLLFTQKLSDVAISRLGEVFGRDRIADIGAAISEQHH